MAIGRRLAFVKNQTNFFLARNTSICVLLVFDGCGRRIVTNIEVNMRTCLALAFILFCAFVVAAQEPTKPVAPGDTVKGSGYIEAGVEAGCKILKDTKSGVVYNLFFSSKDQPPVGTAITFEGTLHEGPTTCMQGKAVDVSSWNKAGASKTKEKTAPPSEKKK
jgi:hypothetical protein